MLRSVGGATQAAARRPQCSDAPRALRALRHCCSLRSGASSPAACAAHSACASSSTPSSSPRGAANGQPVQQRWARQLRRRGAVAAAATAADDVQPVPPAPLATSDDPADLQRDADWIARMVALWLDEEWTPQGVHADLGRAAGASYARLRAGGEDEMGGLLMGLANDLIAFNYRECFVGPFDVANKVVEILMQRDGTEVCCTTDDDRSRAARLEGGGGGA